MEGRSLRRCTVLEWGPTFPEPILDLFQWLDVRCLWVGATEKHMEWDVVQQEQSTKDRESAILFLALLAILLLDTGEISSSAHRSRQRHIPETP